VWFWTGNSSEEAYTKLWKDENAFAHTIAEKILRYPVTVEIEGDMVILFVSVFDAINTHGVVIDNAVLKEYGIPHKFLGEK